MSEKLGYRTDGTETVFRRGARTDDVRLLLPRDALRRPEWTLQVEGVAECLPALGAAGRT